MTGSDLSPEIRATVGEVAVREVLDEAFRFESAQRPADGRTVRRRPLAVVALGELPGVGASGIAKVLQEEALQVSVPPTHSLSVSHHVGHLVGPGEKL